jgi:hypothetical protein
MTLQQILDHLYSRLNKDQSGNTYNLKRFNNDLLVANIEMFNYYYGLIQGYQPTMPIPAISAEVTQAVTDAMRRLTVNMGGDGPTDLGPLTVTNGVALIPENYGHVDYINYTYVDKSCGGTASYPLFDILTGAQWNNRINSSILNEGVEKYPYCNFQKDYIQFRPKDIERVNFVYWRLPKTPIYDYYIGVQKNIVFMPEGTAHTLLPGEVGSASQTSGTVFSKTIPLDWPDEVHPDFANFLLGYIADNLRSGDMANSVQRRKLQGT